MNGSFVGGRLRRLREERGMSQAALARELSISPSYLNQLEHDARPMTVPVLLRLTTAFGVDAAYFAPAGQARLTSDLHEAFGERVAAGRLAAGDLGELAQRLPEIADLLLDLQRRYRAASEQIAGIVGDRAVPGSVDTQEPHEQVREYFYRRHNYVDELDREAELLAARIGLRRGEVRSGLEVHLSDRHGVTVQVGDLGDRDRQHSFDPRRRSLRLSARLRPGQQAFRMATQLAYLEHEELLSELAEQDSAPDTAAHALIRIGLASYYAAAIILPYRIFHTRAEQARYDIEHLADHFGVGYETVCHRLSTLQRPGLRGVPFSFVRVDRAGNVSKRQSATDFHFSRAGGTCPLWNVYEAFATPGRVHVQVAAMPDGRRYLWTARTVLRAPGGWGRPGKAYAIGLGCELRHAPRLVYSAGLDLADESAATPIGRGCRTCERDACPQRAVPQLGRGLLIDQNASTFLPYPVLLDGPEGAGGGR